MAGFEGDYYKHQKGGVTVAFIAGRCSDHAFIQLVTEERAEYVRFPLAAYQRRVGEMRIGDNRFCPEGVEVCLQTTLGRIDNHDLTPLHYDIMGPFAPLPMQCRHSITSLHHRLEGGLVIEGAAVDFSGGVGYIEGDAGRSFPRSYAWMQCNDFAQKACITASVADIPFVGLRFRGCICVVYVDGTEYRLATYLGVKIRCCTSERLVLEQGRLRLEVDLRPATSCRLAAPNKGEMTREIRECLTCGGQFRFYRAGEPLLDVWSGNVSCEFVE